MKGFTLLEVLLVSLLLAMLGMATFSSVRGTLRAKEDIDQRTEIVQSQRAVVAILERDIRAAYYFVAEDFIWAPVTPKADDPNPPPPAVKPLPVTIFQGKSNELFFSARSHQRMAMDSPENEQHFVTYQIHNDELVRAESRRAASLYDRDDPEKFDRLTLLKNVKKLEFKYWDKRTDRWTDSWDTDKADASSPLPLAVQINLEFMPDVPDTARRKVESVKVSTSVALTDPMFRTPGNTGKPASSAAGGNGAGGTPGATPNPSPSPTGTR